MNTIENIGTDRTCKGIKILDSILAFVKESKARMLSKI
jgi:hypothetical protein